jgi:3-hydroxyisobutyrate dehydrogenase
MTVADPGGRTTTMTIAVLGTGIMGAAMARNWLRAGEAVRVWNRSRDKAQPLAADGATVAGEPGEAVDGADAVVTMLFDADAVADVMSRAAGQLAPGTLWLQMSTVGVDGVARLADLAQTHQLTYVDAPVLGTREPAEQGALTVLASGPAELRDRVERLVAPIAASVHWLGEAGTGSRMKLVVNTWVLAATAGFANALALADGLGLDGDDLLRLIGGGPLDLPYAHVKAPLMRKRDYPPSFPVSGAHKDARLILAAAHSAGLDLAELTAVERHLAAAADNGHRDDDMAAMYEAIRFFGARAAAAPG